MLHLNKNRMRLHERLREIIDAYNSGSRGIEDTPRHQERAQRRGAGAFGHPRHARARPDPRNHCALVIDWRKKLAARGAVKVAIRDSLNKLMVCS